MPLWRRPGSLPPSVHPHEVLWPRAVAEHLAELANAEHNVPVHLVPIYAVGSERFAEPLGFVLRRMNA